MADMDFIIAGYEHGGTTLLSEIFRANGYESGFECGVLLGRRPADLRNIAPFWDRLPSSWGIGTGLRDAVVSGDFRSFYDQICAAAFPDHSGAFFDKTPAYMRRLGLCLHRAPFVRGAVVIHRDPRAVFLSMARRIAPGVEPIVAIDQNFAHLVSRYLAYFSGCIGHLGAANTLFVPFEELVTREESWLGQIGRFARGHPFRKRSTVSRFDEVSDRQMQPGRATEYQSVLPRAQQDRILTATALAAQFFADPAERLAHASVWERTAERVTSRLQRHGLPALGMTLDGELFEPLTYLLQNPDVLAAEVNPIDHYLRHGRDEGRWPA